MSMFPPFRSLLPVAMLALLGALALAGCGTPEDNKAPTAATTATIGGVQALTDALYDSALNAGNSTPNLPFSAAPNALAGSEAGAFTEQMMGALGASSLPTDIVDTTQVCRGNGGGPAGSIAIVGDITVTDLRDINPPRDGTVQLDVVDLATTATDCAGHGYVVNGYTALNVNDEVTKTLVNADVDHWVLNRDESGSGTLAITRVTDNALYNVTYSWSRRGTIALDYNTSTDKVEGNVSIDQTVGIAVNGQSCSGRITAFTLFSGYTWVCTGQ